MPPKIPKIQSSLPPALAMRLRPNRSVAPGKPDMPAPRKSSAEVAAEKTQKEQDKENKQKALDDGIKTLSKLEDEMQQNDKENDITANHPPVLTKSKVGRKAPTSAIGEIPY